MYIHTYESKQRSNAGKQGERGKGGIGNFEILGKERKGWSERKGEVERDRVHE